MGPTSETLEQPNWKALVTKKIITHCGHPQEGQFKFFWSNLATVVHQSNPFLLYITIYTR